MVVHLVEAARLAANSGDFKKAGVLETFVRNSPFISRLPFVSINGATYSWTREAALPSTAFRTVNAGYTESAGTTATLHEPLKIAGGDLDVDKFIIDTHGGQVRSIHEAMKAKALAQNINLKLFKGDATVTSNEFNGLRTRYGGVTAPATTQQIANNGASQAISMAKLDETIDAVDGTVGTKYLVMTQAARRAIKQFLRGSSTAIMMMEDQFGIPIESYQGLPILIADPNGDQAAISNDEQGASRQSIYCVAMGPMGLHGIQSGDMQVRDLGELPTSPVFRTRIEWYVGLVDEHPRCVARLYNCNAGVTAVA